MNLDALNPDLTRIKLQQFNMTENVKGLVITLLNVAYLINAQNRTARYQLEIAPCYLGRVDLS
ncbi:hypothetical protein D5018_17825 [Parashewanella curva]|uniref:Uncharacterized protein n=1 Tax=Parashewanella curva TaxID=2338552 RepID=A0A3L8PU45_9GAMM|nr:hypothetical protein D5018_17825 [Parashewanella curva]